MLRLRFFVSPLLVVAFWSLAANAAAAEPAPQFVGMASEFVKRHCLDCHSGSEPAAGVPLDIYRDNDSLVKDRKVWDRVLEMVEFGQMPPEDAEQPKDEDVAQFVQLVKSVFDYHDLHAKPDPGRVTMRRLNRNEYNNTIRDLVGVDFNPAEDFPQDDIGHGFDNIGDVLTLSPVLMERYLAAAESIVRRAIVPNPPAPPKRAISGRYTEPAGGDVSTGRFRPISNRPSEKPTETGPVFTRYKIPDGEYIFRTRIYATREGDDQRPVRFAVLACSPTLTDGAATDAEADSLFGLAVNGLRPFRIVHSGEVTASNDEKDAQTIEIKLPIVPGLDRTAIALYKPAEGESHATLHIEHLSLEGPLDTRPESHRRLLACDPNADRATQTREVLRRFMTRAYRRPATDAEVERLAEFVAAAEADGAKWEAAMQLAIQAVLVSPKFLFRVELEADAAGDEVIPLNEFQIASRLSYFLWSTMPDDELLELAQRGELSKQIDAQVRRMLADPRADQLVEHFALQWLQIKRLETFAPDKELFPMFDDDLRGAMLDETRLFFAAVMREDRSILELLHSDFTYLNEPLARHYGLTDAFRAAGGSVGRGRSRRNGGGDEFVRVSLPDASRGGLLTQASVLTVTSNPTRTSPVKRGRWVLEQLLGSPPPPPPPNVPELEAQKEKLTGSLRERMEQHRQNPACASCHARMDPLGFAFENFDAVGRFRVKDGEYDIDPSGELPGGQTFAGPGELKQILQGRKQMFARCLTEKMMTYALGRGLEYYDRPAVNRIVRQLEANDFKFSTLVVEIVSSDPFRLRRS
ncbi:MAG: DUF1592 domain-containing protein [Pirellulaceae bacterium]